MPQPPSAEQLRSFVASVFTTEPGAGQLEPWHPEDHHPAPALLARLPAGAVREWGAAINGLWPQLGRRLTKEAARHPERHTLLELSHGVIVPGGRFREAYYWDSYWVVLGLLAVDMADTARRCGFQLGGLLARRVGWARSARRHGPSPTTAAASLSGAAPIADSLACEGRAGGAAPLCD